MSWTHWMKMCCNLIFFDDVAKFLLQVAFVSRCQYCMPKQRVVFIITVYENVTIDWGYLTVVTIREQFHNVQRGKLMRPIIAM